MNDPINVKLRMQHGVSGGLCESCGSEFFLGGAPHPDGRCVCPSCRGEAKKVEGIDPKLADELQRRGIVTEDPSTVLDGIANRIVSNEQLCAFLLGVETSRRKDAYDALRDRLHFSVESFLIVMNRKKTVLRRMKTRLRFVPKQAIG